MAVRVKKCDKYMCRVAVPSSSLILLPRAKYFERPWRAGLKTRKNIGVAVGDLPRGTVVKVGGEYWIIDREPRRLRARRAKILYMNAWGIHLEDRVYGTVAILVYDGRRLVAVSPPR